MSDVYPGLRGRGVQQAEERRGGEEPGQGAPLTRLLYRHWDEWRENIRHHVFVADVDERRRRSTSRPAISIRRRRSRKTARSRSRRTASEIAFVSNREGNDREAWTTNHDVWIVPVAGGEAQKLTTNPAADVQPVFSPDGRTLFVRAQRRPGFESDRWYLDAYDRATGAQRTLFETPDLSVERLSRCRPTARSIWFTAAQDGRREPLRRRRRRRHAEGASLAGRRDLRGAGRTRTSSCSSKIDADVAGRALPRVGATARDVEAADARERVVAEGRRVLAAGEPDGAERRRRAKFRYLAAQAAGLRPGEEVPGRLPDPRRPAGRVGGRLVVALEPVAVGGAGLGRRRAEPARLDRLRPEVRRRDLAATGAAR